MKKENNKSSSIDKQHKISRIKGVQSTGIALLLALLILLVSIPVNLIAQSANVKWDMTPNRLYTLTETSKNALKTLNNNINIYWLYDMDSAKDSDEFAPLYNTLMQYDKYDKINVIEADPDTTEGAEMVNNLGIDSDITLNTGDFVVKAGNIIKTVAASSMYTSETTTDETTGETVSTITGFSGENFLTGTIMYVDKFATADLQPTIYFLTGHGEKSLSDSYSNIGTYIKQKGYKVEELNLSGMDKVPDETQLIVIAGPTSDISINEKDMINDYLDNGGCMIFLMSPDDGKFDYLNISSVLNDYAIGINYDRVKETNTAYMVNDDQYNIAVELQDATEDSAVDLTTAIMNMSGLVPSMYNSRSFYSIYTDNYTNLTIEPVIATYDSAVSEPYGGTNPDPDETEGPVYLSYYSVDSDRNNSKIFTLGNADVLDNDHISQEYTITANYMFLSAVSWMHDESIDMGIPSKEKDKDYMNIDSESNANQLMILLIVIPILVAGSGIVVWGRRRVS